MKKQLASWDKNTGGTSAPVMRDILNPKRRCDTTLNTTTGALFGALKGCMMIYI
jgi:hypothetical protein